MSTPVEGALREHSCGDGCTVGYKGGFLKGFPFTCSQCNAKWNRIDHFRFPARLFKCSNRPKPHGSSKYLK